MLGVNTGAFSLCFLVFLVFDFGFAFLFPSQSFVFLLKGLLLGSRGLLCNPLQLFCVWGVLSFFWLLVLKICGVRRIVAVLCSLFPC